MRIVLVTTEYITEETNFDGGLANYTHRAALSLRLMGHEPIVVVASNRRETLTHAGIEVHRVPVICYKPVLRYFFFFMAMDWLLISYSINREIRAIHRKQRVDVIQYSSLGATALFRVPGIPAVARLSSYQKMADEAYEYNLMLKALVFKARHYLERTALRRVDVVFGPSRIVGEALARDIGREVELIESPYLPDACALDDSAYREIATKLKGREYLLFFGTIGLLKGIKTIGNMIYRLFEHYPELCFVFVGKDLGLTGCSAIQYIRERAGQYSERVIYRERLHHDRLYPIIQHARLVILPSRFDNFPNTCIEAMAFKKIVIGTRGTSFEELITDGVSGFLCERDNPDNLFEVINSAMQLPYERCVEIGEKAYQRIGELDPNAIVNKLLCIYARAMETNRLAR
jgi:glycosyltransferase involved in cell wall biosynthesis